MKRTIYFSLSAIMAISACSCQGEEIPSQSGNHNPSVMPGGDRASDNNNPVTEPFSVHFTDAVPSEYFQPASEQGTVEVLWYDSKDYTSSSKPATRKPAYVYLPYGYDPSQKYDVIYLLHGWTGVAQEPIFLTFLIFFILFFLLIVTYFLLSNFGTTFVPRRL